jgi:hypothetical protein
MLPVTTQVELFQQQPIKKPSKPCGCFGKKTKHKHTLTRYENDHKIQVKAKETLEPKKEVSNE